MFVLYIGIALFAGTHLFSTLLPDVRGRLMAWLGEQKYKVFYSLISVAGLILMGWGYAFTRNDGVMAYQPMAGARHVTMLLVFLGFVFIASNDGKGYIRAWLKHPFSIGVSLWAIGHLLANGKMPLVMIASTMLAVSICDILSSIIRQEKMHFSPQIKRDIIAIIAGVVVYAVFLFAFHPYILGVPILH
jgi:uncharacterized membrane protein